MRIPDDFMQELKMRSDITDVVSSYVNLKRRGKNMVGLCPFHGEKTPSFNLYPENGSFFCFGCGAGGDVITFIRKIENLDYIEAVKFLAQRAGMDMPESSYDDTMSRLRNRVYEANREAARFFHKCLYSADGTKGLDYFRKRELKESTIKHFGLGYAPPGGFNLVNHLKKSGFTDNEIIQANLAFKSKNGHTVDRFFDRVMFPIIDLRGNVIAFGGRIMNDSKPKYLNTSDTVVFKKSINLFALNMAKNTGMRQLILAEGYMDVIALHQAGFQNTVATLGTALTPQQAILIKRYADEVVISYDSDEAGKKAASRAIKLLRDAGLSVKVLTIPGSKDPDEFIKSHKDSGPARFKHLIDSCGNDIEYTLQNIKNNYDVNLSEGKVAYLTEAAKLLAELDNIIECEIYASKLSEECGVQKEAIIQQIKRFSRQNRTQKEKKEFRNIQTETSAVKDKINPQKSIYLRGAKAEEALIAYLMNNPDMAHYITNKLPAEKMLTDFNKRIYKIITDRLLVNKSAALTDISQDFTTDEMSKIAEILSKHNSEANSVQSADEYINVILTENDKIDAKQAANTSSEDLLKYMEILRKNKK